METRNSLIACLLLAGACAEPAPYCEIMAGHWEFIVTPVEGQGDCGLTTAQAERMEINIYVHDDGTISGNDLNGSHVEVIGDAESEECSMSGVFYWPPEGNIVSSEMRLTADASTGRGEGRLDLVILGLPENSSCSQPVTLLGGFE